MDRAELQLRRRKARDRSLALTLIGAALMLPPAAGLFRIDATVFGAPFILVYLFGVWAALIVGAALLARRLQDGDEP